MNYARIYDELMERARHRIIDGYVEKHHVIPRCMGGDNSKANIVILTASEHYVAHLLLVKMNPGNRKLLWAATAMTNGTKHQERSKNKMYEWLRRRLAVAMSEREVSAETRAKLSQAKQGNLNMLGKTHSAATKELMSAKAKGRVFTPEHREKLRQAKLGKPGVERTPEWIAKLSQSQKESAKHRDFAYTQTVEYKSHQAEKMRQVWAKRRSGEMPMPQNFLTEI